MRVHALCKAFPRPTMEKKGEIKASIQRIGLLEALWGWKDENDNEWLVDGLTRSTIIDELHREGVHNAENGKEITREVRWFQGTKKELFDFVMGENFQRRELTQSQRAMLVVELQETEQKYKGKEAGDMATLISKANGINRQYYFHATKLKKYCDENNTDSKLKEEVLEGTTTLPEAMRKMKSEQNPPPVPGEGDEPKEDDVLDGLKRPVPKEFKNLFQTRDLYAAAAKHIRDADKILKALKSDKKLKAGVTIPDEFAKEFLNLHKSTKEFAPFCICPYCNGVGKNPEDVAKKCLQCKGSKYLDKVQFALVPDELKAVMKAGMAAPESGGGDEEGDE